MLLSTKCKIFLFLAPKQMNYSEYKIKFVSAYVMRMMCAEVA